MVSLLLAKDVRSRSSSHLKQTNKLKALINNKNKKTGIRLSFQQRQIGRRSRQSSDAPRRLLPSRGRLGRFLRRRVERTRKTASRRGVQSRSVLRTRLTPRHRTCLPLGVWSPGSLDRYVHPPFFFILAFHARIPVSVSFTLMPTPLTTATYRPGGCAFYRRYV